MTLRKFIVYYRVSTKRQGESALGLDAQRKQVTDFVRSRNADILDEYTEIESGGKDDRPQLQRALSAAALYGVPLLIAKLDRLSRSAAFLMTLQESGVDFICADMPDANAMTVGVMALVARQEREVISQRTKAALEQSKARGVRLGGIREGQRLPTPMERRQGDLKRAHFAKVRAVKYEEPLVKAIKAGHTSLNAIAGYFTKKKIPTSQAGTQWQAVQIQRILAHLGTTIEHIQDGIPKR